MGGVIAALADSPVNDEFPNAESKEGSQVFVVLTTATLIDRVARLTSRPRDENRDRIAFCEDFVADLASQFVFGV